MLSPKKSPRAVFCRQMKLKIANSDIGEAQRDPWVIVHFVDISGIIEHDCLNFLFKMKLL